MSNWKNCWVINVKNPLDCWLDDGRWVGTPTTIYPVEKGDYNT